MIVKAQGVRMMDVACVAEALSQVLICNCGSGNFELKEDLNQSECLYSALFFSCVSCEFCIPLPTSYKTQEVNYENWEINLKTEKIIYDLGIKEHVLEDIFKYYNIPFVKSSNNCMNSHGISNLESDRNSVSDSETSENIDTTTRDYNTTKLSDCIKPARITKPKKCETKECDVHELSFSTCAELTQHVKLHTASKLGSQKCPQCNKVFPSFGSLQEHEKLHIIHCTKCSSVFTSEFELRNHLSTHTENQKTCPICGKSFKKKCHLIHHTQRHTGEKPYLCSVCGKSFGDSSTLNRHQKGMHSNERSLQCNVCGKTFYHSGHLREHIRTHSGEKPYVCKICNKTFAHSTSLKKHSSIHSTKCEFQCSFCSRAFKWRESLKQHVKTHSQKKSLEEDWNNVQRTGCMPINETVNSGIEVNISEQLVTPVTVSNTNISSTHVISYMAASDTEYF